MGLADKLFPNDVAADDIATASERARQLLGHVSLPLGERRADDPAALLAQIEAEVTELFREHVATLFRYAAAVARDRAVAQDGIQEAFLRYFTTRVRGQRMENPRAWLFRVLRNYILDRHRQNRSMALVDLEAVGHLTDHRQDVEERYEKGEALRRALSSLSRREQECVQLRLAGLDYGEIALVLRIRPGTVGALLARGLKKIRKNDMSPGRQAC
jgi:RNA polymerase sigma-70 factor (ECF subfamily)